MQQITSLKTAQIVPSQTAFQISRRANRAPGDIESMAENIKLHGLISPIVVRPFEKDCFEIVAGEGRWLAHKHAKIGHIAAIVRHDISDKDLLKMQIAENTQRHDIDPVTKGIGYNELQQKGMTVREMGAEFGTTAATISTYIQLTNLSETQRRAVQCKKISIDAAAALAALDKPTREKLWGQVESSGWTQAQSLTFIRSHATRDEDNRTWNLRAAELTSMFPSAIFQTASESEAHFAPGSDQTKLESPFRLASMPLDRKFCEKHSLEPGTTWGKLATQLSAPKYIFRDGRMSPVLCVHTAIRDQLEALTAATATAPRHPSDPVSAELVKRHHLSPGITWGALALQVGAAEEPVTRIDEPNILRLLAHTPAQRTKDTTPAPAPAEKIAAMPLETIFAGIDARQSVPMIWAVPLILPMFPKEFRDGALIDTAEDMVKHLLKIRFATYNDPKIITEKYSELMDI